jgi:hypothetical protein
LTLVTQTLSVLRRLGTVIAIAIVFLLGLATTVYLSLRSPEVKVPEVVGKDRFLAERQLQDAGLNFRVRATRPSNQVKSDTVMFQLPHAGEVVKAGQTVAVDVARATKEGEASETITTDEKAGAQKANENNNASASSSPNLNENKPKRKNANANNANNANANSNSNRNANANRPNANAKANANRTNANSGNTRVNNNNRGTQPENLNTNRPPANVNRTPPKPAPTPPERQ